MTRLSHAPPNVRASAQRDSNPHLRHGKTVGRRYPMGTLHAAPDCQKARAPGGSRTHVTALRGRCHPDGRPVLCTTEWDPRDSNPHPPVKSRVCCRLHLGPCLRTKSASEWAGWRSNPRLRCFKPPLNPLSYRPAQQKSPVVLRRHRAEPTSRLALVRHVRRGYEPACAAQNADRSGPGFKLEFNSHARCIAHLVEHCGR